MEPKNKRNKFAVAVMKNEFLVGRLPKRKTGRFANGFPLPSSLTQTLAPSKLLEKRSIEEMGKGMKVSCKLYFAAEDGFINILKEELPKAL